MTPEQCADMIIAEIREADRMAFSYYRPEMVKLIGQVIAAEREACAKVAAVWGEREDLMTDTAYVPGASYGERYASSGIAAAIRARGETPE